MALLTKIIKGRIKSIANIRKITRAMEMVSASKMRKSTGKAVNTRTYAELALELLVNIAKEKRLAHPLIKGNSSPRALLVVIASSKGLCGAYNINVLKAANKFIKNKDQSDFDFVTVGKYAERLAKKSQSKIIGSFINFSDDLTIEEINGLNNLILTEFLAKKYGRVYLVYTNFISAISYKNKVRQLLPIKAENIQDMLEETGAEKEKTTNHGHDTRSLSNYLLEPNKTLLLEKVLPGLTKVQLYQALLESSASEHSARMLAMRNASENAEEMVQELTLSFNQARQAGITQEISEIAAGAEALSNF
jgi:F-type H+-transporting ATPase subunit gamma